MFLKSILLKNFRNIHDLEKKFDKQVTVLIGNNAQGKTNFLESVYFLATGRPIKSETDFEAIKFGKESVWVEGIIASVKEGEDTKLAAALQQSETRFSKKLTVNGIPKRFIDYVGFLKVVFFRPEDLDLVTGPPSARRDYLNHCLIQTDKEYRKILQSYERVIVQKNKLLKTIREGLANKNELEFWNTQEINLGLSLQKTRGDFFKSINSFERKFGDFEYKYIPNEISEARIKEYFDREIASAQSLIGPHRDDFIFLLNDKDLSKYGSRGEQRTAVLDLKMTELNFMENEIGERPVLLLDDIFSELDKSHRQHVLDLSKKQQTIIATVEYDDFLKEALKETDVLKVESGVIS